MPDSKKFDEKFNLSPSIAILLSGALVAGAILFVNLHPTQPVAANPTQLPSANVPAVTSGEHLFGSPTAPIKLVEYSDFQCPYCRLVYPTLKRLVEESNGQIAWVHRNFPLESIHPEARPAALAAECIAEELGNDAFWKFANAIYTDQSKMSSKYYAELAAQFGASPSTFATCVSTEKHAAKIDGEALDAQKNGGEGTPFTVVVGKDIQVPISGALPYAQFVSVIKAVKARQ